MGHGGIHEYGDFQNLGDQAAAIAISWFVFAALKSLGYQDWNNVVNPEIMIPNTCFGLQESA